MYVERSFDWCTFYAFLEKYCWRSPDFHRRRRPETLFRPSGSFARVLVHVSSMFRLLGVSIGLHSLDQATRALTRLCGCQRINEALRFIERSWILQCLRSILGIALFLILFWTFSWSWRACVRFSACVFLNFYLNSHSGPGVREFDPWCCMFSEFISFEFSFPLERVFEPGWMHILNFIQISFSIHYFILFHFICSSLKNH